MWYLIIIIVTFLGLIYYFSKGKDANVAPVEIIQKKEEIKQRMDIKIESYQDFIKNNRKILEKKVVSAEVQIKSHIELYKKFLSGVDESFDQQGNLIPGIPPDVDKAIYHMQQAVLLGFNDGLLEIARIYHRGAYNLTPDTQKALGYYQKYHTHPFAKTAGKIEAQLAMNEIQGQRRPVFDRRMERNRPPERRRNRRRNAEPGVGGQLVEFAIRLIGGNAENHVEDDPIPRRRNDTQNVHEHAVNRQLQLNISELYKSIKPDVHVLLEIRNYISRKAKGDKHNLAIQTLDDIERNDENFEYYQKLTLAEILSIVWIRIKQLKDSENAKEMLLNNLVDCIQHGFPVCATGKIARIVDTLTIFDEDLIKSKPTWMIKEEIQAKAANIRDKEYDKLSNLEKKEVDSINESAVRDRFVNNIIDKIESYARETYLDKEIILEGEFDKIMDEIRKGLN